MCFFVVIFMGSLALRLYYSCGVSGQRRHALIHMLVRRRAWPGVGGDGQRARKGQFQKGDLVTVIRHSRYGRSRYPAWDM